VLPVLRCRAVSALSGQCPLRADRQHRPTTPSADFCRAVRLPCGFLSHDSGTRGRPPEVSSTAFLARPPDLQPCRLMDMGFAPLCRLAPARLPLIRFLSIGPRVRYRFLQTTPRGVALASRFPFTSIRLGRGLAPPDSRTCSAHKGTWGADHLRPPKKKRGGARPPSRTAPTPRVAEGGRPERLPRAGPPACFLFGFC